MDYSRSYYESNGQLEDRPALWLYERLARKYIPAGTVIDFGCGTGALLRRLSKHFTPIGFEKSNWAIRELQHLGITTLQDTSQIPSKTISGIVSIHVFEHIEDSALETVLQEWRRILRKDGRAIVVTPDKGGYAASTKGPHWSALTDPTHINLKSHNQWREFFSARGLNTIAECADGLWDFPYRHPRLGKAEVALLGWPTLIQYLIARPILAPGSGEAAIFILEPV